MARRGKHKGSYIADPEKRAQMAALRTVRDQVFREHEKELSEAGLLKRILLRMRMEREIRHRMKGPAGQSPGRR